MGAKNPEKYTLKKKIFESTFFGEQKSRKGYSEKKILDIFRSQKGVERLNLGQKTGNLCFCCIFNEIFFGVQDGIDDLLESFWRTAVDRKDPRLFGNIPTSY